MKNEGYVKYFTAIAALVFAYFYIYPSQSPKVTPVIQVLENVRKSLHFQTHTSTADIAELYANGCPEHHFASVRQLSRSPDIMIIDGFITPEEAQILVKAAYLTSPFSQHFRCERIVSDFFVGTRYLRNLKSLRAEKLQSWI